MNTARINTAYGNPPVNNNLQTIIQEKKLSPVTILREINARMRDRLASSGIIMLMQLLFANPETLSISTGMGRETFKQIIEKEKEILI